MEILSLNDNITQQVVTSLQSNSSEVSPIHIRLQRFTHLQLLLDASLLRPLKRHFTSIQQHPVFVGVLWRLRST